MNDAAKQLLSDVLNQTAPMRAQQHMAALERERAEQKQSGEYREEDWDERPADYEPDFTLDDLEWSEEYE